jgi:hypothetical protein
MSRLMVIGGGNLERAPNANIVMFFKNCGLKCTGSLRGLSSACPYPVDLVVIEVSAGGKEVHYIMLLDLPGPVTWTPSAPSVIMGRRGG